MDVEQAWGQFHNVQRIDQFKDAACHRIALRSPHGGIYKVADQVGCRSIAKKARQNRLNDTQQVLTVFGNGQKKFAGGAMAQEWGDLRRHHFLKQLATTIGLGPLSD
jgi:hypothetical protein